MPYNNIISRTETVIPEVVSNDLLNTYLPQESAALTLFRQTRMSSSQTRMPVLSALPLAYFVNGDTGLKQTTEVNWANKYINAEELATIVPIPEAVVADATFDMWATIKPLIAEAIGRALDAAIFFGTNKPVSWPDAIVPAAVGAGNVVARGTATQANGGIAEDLNQTFAKVEADGFTFTGHAANPQFKARIRSARATDGQKLLDVNTNQLEGAPIRYVMAGMWPTGFSAAELITGDYNQGILGVRQDITTKILDQAVIQDATGAIVYNLAQQDMVALRVVFRVGFQVANTINSTEANEAARYPFAVLRSPAA